jgi:hypothetical protein
MPHDNLPALRVLVAMPSTDLGPDTTWKQPAEVSFHGREGAAPEEVLLADVLEPGVRQGVRDAIDLLESGRRAAIDSTSAGEPS